MKRHHGWALLIIWVITFLCAHQFSLVSRLTLWPSRIDGSVGQTLRPLTERTVMRDLCDRVLARSIASSSVMVISTAASPSAAIIARREGHHLHMLRPEDPIDVYWERSNRSIASWVLLMVIDAGGREAKVLSNAREFLAGSTVTYLVLSFNPTAAAAAGSNLSAAVDQMLTLKYKVQVLAATHYIPPFAPNTLIHEGNLANFTSMVRERHASFLLFLTQGLDLAIPSVGEYLNTSFALGCTGKASVGSECDGSLPLPAVARKCPSSTTLDILWAEDVKRNFKGSFADWSVPDTVRLLCDGRVLDIRNPKQRPKGRDAWRLKRIWFSHTKPSLAEGVCAEVRCGGADGPVSSKCTTRVLRTAPVPTRTRRKKTTTKTQEKRSQSGITHRPNFLVLLLDPLSRSQFRRLMPETSRFLEEHQFLNFKNYGVVGANSGPNQAALFSGSPLASRSGIATHNNTFEWIWDRLRRNGWATLKGEDNCILNTNMLAQIKPHTHHGRQLDGLYCFDFQRPNCVGGESASHHLLSYTKKFMDVYQDQPWAAFLSFTDSHEDSMSLAVSLDHTIRDFLHWFHFPTVPVAHNLKVRAIMGYYGDSVDSIQFLNVGGVTRHFGQRGTGSATPWFPLGTDEYLIAVEHSSAPGSIAARCRHPADAVRLFTSTGRSFTILGSRARSGGTKAGMQFTCPGHPRCSKPLHHGHYSILGKFLRYDASSSHHITGLEFDDSGCIQGISQIRMIPTRSQGSHRSRDTAVILLSDHGLHYGPFFRTTAGQRERAEPLLYMSLPGHLRMPASNPSKLVSPFDVHATLVDIATPEEPGFPTGETPGQSLLRPLPDRRCREAGIPMDPRYCPSFPGRSPWNPDTGACDPLPAAPSLLAFYSDMAKENRPSLPRCRPIRKHSRRARRHISTSPDCSCSTNLRTWTFCPEKFSLKAGEHFTLVWCQQSQFEYHIHFERAPKVDTPAVSSPPPNLIHLELDSVSSAYARRHFPRTMAFLQRLEVSATSAPPKQPFVSFEFDLLNSVGAASLHNQIPALSGCIASHPGESEREALRAARYMQSLNFKEHPMSWAEDLPFPLRIWCPVGAQMEEGTNTPMNESQVSPWIFGLAKALGFTSWNSEDFCSKKSFWAPQMYFPGDDADFVFSELYCRALELPEEKKPISKIGHCLGGEFRFGVSLKHLMAFFQAHSHEPKIAFLNTNTAHNYTTSMPHMALLSEALDEYLESFLSSLVARADAGNTIIIIQGDHGLQGGPHMVDYAMQIEHRRPFLTFLLPSKLATPAVRQNLAVNRRRLVTAFDLHKTMRNFLLRHKSRQVEAVPPAVPWAYDLLEERVPKSRSCHTAHIPLDFCSCGNEFSQEHSPQYPSGTPHAPNLGTCNWASAAEQKQFCRAAHVTGVEPEPGEDR